jgi:hypothetical protein
MPDNPYGNYLRNVPGVQRQLRVGEPVHTKWGQGVITDIHGISGGFLKNDYNTGPQGIIISVLLVGAKLPIDIPLNFVYSTNTIGYPPL